MEVSNCDRGRGGEVCVLIIVDLGGCVNILNFFSVDFDVLYLVRKYIEC